MFHGACEDKTLPAPRVADDDGEWTAAEEKEGDVQEDDYYDGAWEENGPQFEKTDSLQQVLMLDPDIALDDDEVAALGDADLPAEFDAVEPDVKEGAAFVEAVRGEVVVPEGGAPPVGWRIDKFGHRLVSTPPWSRRPHTCWPEQWVGITK